jgi:PPK2 family polyphosphate:nucleotide phosphotransferase
MKVAIDRFRVRPGQKVDLRRRPTRVAPLCGSKEEYSAALSEHVRALDELEQRHIAANRHALLVIFQGMDASGKDGAIRHVMSGVDPRACNVFGFKQPSSVELEHDFIWRTIPALPMRGRIAIFNRSYYEEVIVVRVHADYLRSEGVSGRARVGGKLWQGRYESIRDFEKHLHRSGTRIVKFFLHVSKEEQRQRLLSRLDDPKKSWKVSPDDIRERKLWDRYRKAYEACLPATSTDDAPWYVVPADDKPNARLIVSQGILDTLAATRPQYPLPTAKRRRELRAFRRMLAT